MQGDFQEAVRNPRRALQYLSELRWRAKLYTHFKEIFADETYKWLDDRIISGTILIDIGAFVGDSAIYFSRNPNVKKVLAFEAMPGTWKEGEKILQNRKDPKIIYNNLAVGSKEGFLNLPSSRQGGIAAASRMSKGKTKVPVIPLEQVIGSNNKIAIKCDVEGDEYNIFMGQSKHIFKNVYAIIMEVHKHNIDSQRLLKQMKEYGFRVSQLEHGEMASLYGFQKNTSR